ncbi:DUF6230 family protein [Sphaerisporangium perillae]|uniref:DUF6230 family protein n=1 Tax=Sphaerisporangium perillae TaxID=2935860 RepID=UPI0020109031|nr:DUF6230 family protein [Sphaerisporangium perillae]
MREQGRVRWKRFALLFVPATVVATLLVGAAVQGAIGASFVVAGTPIKISASLIKALGVVEFGSTVEMKNGKVIPVYVVGARRVETFDLCQSVKFPTPLGPVTLKTTAGDQGEPVTSEHQVTKALMIAGDTTYTDLEVGRDASTLDTVPGITGPPGTFGQQSTTVVTRNSRQILLALSAAKITLPDSRLRVLVGDHPCF